MTVATAIVIAAYNAAPTIERAIASALAQPETAEVCVVDDASSDATLATIRALAAGEPRLKVIAQEGNRGPAAARNAAIAASSSPWIAILDADDYLLPGRLGRLHRAAAQADFIADALIRVQPGHEPADVAADFAPQPMSLETFLLGNLGDRNRPLDLGFLKPLMRREFLGAHGLRYREDMRLGEDYLLYGEALALGGRFLVGGHAGYVSVERPGSLSKEHSEEDLRRMRDCDDHLGTLRALTQSERRALARHWTSVDCRLQWRRLITAVKARDLGMALSTFHTADAALYLAARLSEQVWVRTIGRRPALS